MVNFRGNNAHWCFLVILTLLNQIMTVIQDESVGIGLYALWKVSRCTIRLTEI